MTGSTTLTNWVIAQRKIVLSWQGDTSATWSTQGSLLVVTYDSSAHYIFANITNKVALDDVALTYNTSTTYTDVSSTPYSRTVTGLSGTAKIITP